MLVLAGCSEYSIEKTDPDDLTGYVYPVECPNIDCHSIFELPLSDLLECFGTDPENPDAWHPDTPEEIIENCDPADPSMWCVVPIPVTAPGGYSNCPCEMGEEGDPASSGCCDDSDFDYEFDGEPADVFSHMLESRCPEAGYSPLSPDCPIDPDAGVLARGPQGVTKEEMCPTWFGAQIRLPPTVDFVLTIDPLVSYVALTTATESMQVSLSGSGGIDASPSRILTAAAWADTGKMGGVEYLDWVLFFETPIDMSLSMNGEFKVPASPSSTIHGVGLVDDVMHELTVPLTADAIGYYDSSTLTWDLDLHDSYGGNQITVHLEGPYVRYE